MCADHVRDVTSYTARRWPARALPRSMPDGTRFQTITDLQLTLRGIGWCTIALIPHLQWVCFLLDWLDVQLLAKLSLPNMMKEIHFPVSQAEYMWEMSCLYALRTARFGIGVCVKWAVVLMGRERPMRGRSSISRSCGVHNSVSPDLVKRQLLDLFGTRPRGGIRASRSKLSSDLPVSNWRVTIAICDLWSHRGDIVPTICSISTTTQRLQQKASRICD